MIVELEYCSTVTLALVRLVASSWNVKVGTDWIPPIAVADTGADVDVVSDFVSVFGSEVVRV